MTLREFLEIHKSSNRLHIEEYREDSKNIKIGLIQNIKILPESYLDSEVIETGYKMEIDNLSKIVIVPAVAIKIKRDN